MSDPPTLKISGMALGIIFATVGIVWMFNLVNVSKYWLWFLYSIHLWWMAIVFPLLVQSFV